MPDGGVRDAQEMIMTPPASAATLEQLVENIDASQRVAFLDFILYSKSTPDFDAYLERDENARSAAEAAMRLLTNSFKPVIQLMASG